MKTRLLVTSSVVAVLLSLAVSAHAQALIKKSIFKTDTADFGVAGTISVTGAPNGSITIESWNKNEIEISAEIVVEAPNEADLATISEVSGFAIDQSFNSLRIISVGTFDKDYLKRKAKKFPKRLLTMPLTINYTLKVPRYADLNITGGRGEFKLKAVDGAHVVNFIESNAVIELVGGSLQSTIASGNVELSIPTRNWRGRFADVAITSGTLNVKLPAGLNADVEASVLREGEIRTTFAELKPKNKKVPFTEKSVSAVAGIGGIPLKFTLGNGVMVINGN